MSATLSLPDERPAMAAAHAKSRPRNVLYVANSWKIGGGNRSLIDLISRLDRSRYQPRLVSPAEGPLTEWARTSAIPYHVVDGDDWGGRLGLLGRACRLLALVLRERIDVVHAMAPTCYRAAGLAGRIAGAVRVCHLGYPPERGELAWSFRSGPDAVIGCYEQQATDAAPEVARLAPRCRVIGISNGIDIARFAPRGPAATELRAALGIGGGPLVLIVGHLSEVKGHPTFLRAAKTVLDRVPQCRFAALGGETITAGYGAELQRLAAELGLADRMHFLGFRNDVPAVLQAADIVALPSQAEGLPLAVLEAMACARPVVATPVGGVPDAVVEGVTGHLVPPDDVARLAEAIVGLLQNPVRAARMGAEGRRRAETYFSLDRFVSGVERLYDELLTP
jgi:glycosyltransferase involved in cell wall biosynthesis